MAHLQLRKQEPLPKQAIITGNQVKILKLRQKGLSKRQIARELQVSNTAISSSLRAIRENWPHLKQLMKEVEDNDLEVLITGEATLKHLWQLVEKKVKDGRYIGGTPPWGFNKDKEGNLIEIPDQRKVVIQLFIGADSGKSIGQMAKETGLSKDRVRYILRNPVYKGMVRWMGQVYVGQHPPMVDPRLFNRVQQKLKAGPKFGLRSLPFGYRYDLEGRIRLDPEKAERIKPLWSLRLQRMNRVEIAKRLGMSAEQVRWRLRNSFYAAKRKVGEKWVDMDHRPIIDFETWLAANEVRVTRGDTVAGRQRKVRDKNRNRILKILAVGPKTCREVAHETGLCEGGIYKHLHRLEKKGFIEKILPERQRKGPVPSPSKWQIRTE